ncbi:helix-turn-helix transcriptional regulator [Streptomyces griseoviridis]
MGIAERRRFLGYNQDRFAEALGVDRTTVGRWEGGKHAPQALFRPKLAEVLQVGLDELDSLLAQVEASPRKAVGQPPSGQHGSGEDDDMIRREFLRTIAMTGALAAISPDDLETLGDESNRGSSQDFLRMNEHLWRVYQLARAKQSVLPIVREQLAALHRSMVGRSNAEVHALCRAAGDLFQLAGELAFDSNRYTDAAASYTLAASVSKDARSFDLWACALIRHAYVDVFEHRYKEALDILAAAERIAKRGDSGLSTRYWVASVQAVAHAGLDDLAACERAMDEAEKVRDLKRPASNGGWLRFDGSRLDEERGARYAQLGMLDRAEETLKSALKQDALSEGQSFRRRGAVLADLAAIGAQRRDPDQVVTYGAAAMQLARESSSGYVARRLLDLRSGFGSLTHDRRVAELGAEIDALSIK